MMIDAAKHKTSDWTELTFPWKAVYIYTAEMR